MELLGGWDRVRRNLVGTFFLQAKAELIEAELHQPPDILLLRQTYTLPTTELEREYRKLDELDESLENARQEYNIKQKEFGLRWHQCSEKNDLLQKFVKNFDEYFKVSSSKQEADKLVNAKLDQELWEKNREVRKLQKQLARLKLVKVELENRLQISMAYKDFMASVAKESQGEFENVGQVIARYHELKKIREQYVRKIVDQVTTAFELERDLRDLMQECKTEEIAGKTYLSEMETYKGQLQVSNWRRYDNLLAIKEGLKRQLLMTHFPKKAIHNLYLLLCQEMEQPVQLEENDFRKQLEFIQRFLNELVKLSKRTKDFFDCPSDVPLVSEQEEKKRVL